MSCASASVVRGGAQNVVEIRLRGRYFMEPATVQIIVAVEPDADNRLLRIDADSDDMYRASDVTLNGTHEKRLHFVEFRNLQAGQYTLRAAVFSADALRGMATQELLVTGPEQRQDTRQRGAPLLKPFLLVNGERGTRQPVGSTYLSTGLVE